MNTARSPFGGLSRATAAGLAGVTLAWALTGCGDDEGAGKNHDVIVQDRFYSAGDEPTLAVKQCGLELDTPGVSPDGCLGVRVQVSEQVYAELADNATIRLLRCAPPEPAAAATADMACSVDSAGR